MEVEEPNLRFINEAVELLYRRAYPLLPFKYPPDRLKHSSFTLERVILTTATGDNDIRTQIGYLVYFGLGFICFLYNELVEEEEAYFQSIDECAELKNKFRDKQQTHIRVSIMKDNLNNRAILLLSFFSLGILCANAA